MLFTYLIFSSSVCVNIHVVISGTAIGCAAFDASRYASHLALFVVFTVAVLVSVLVSGGGALINVTANTQAIPV